MEEKNDNLKKKETKPKGFWKGLFEKLDQKMVEKANQSSCCGNSKDSKCC